MRPSWTAIRSLGKRGLESPCVSSSLLLPWPRWFRRPTPSSSRPTTSPYPTLGGGSGSTAWQASALGGLYVGSGGQLSTNNADAALTLTFSSGDVYAVGGNFFLTDINFGFLPGLVQVELADGSSYIANIQSANAFSGFVSLGSAISQITISPFGIQPNAYVTATNLCLGVVPAPGAVALLAVAGLASRRRR